MLLLKKDVLCVGSDDVAVLKVPFLKQHEVMQKQLIMQALEYLVPGRKDIGSKHVEDILSLFTKETGKRISLPYGLVAENTYEKVVLRKKAEETTKSCFEVSVPGKISLEEGKYIEFTVFSGNIHMEIPQKTYTKWFDYDKIISCLELRNRKTGDYLTISENGNRKSIKEYFIEEKIPRQDREKIFLLSDGSHILWVIGKRISEYYKVTEQTKTILQAAVLTEDKNI